MQDNTPKKHNKKKRISKAKTIKTTQIKAKTITAKAMVLSVDQNGDEMYKESTAKGRYYTVIEVKEHQRLLSLYYACFTAAQEQSPSSINMQNSALEACNRFFAGGSECQK